MGAYKYANIYRLCLRALGFSDAVLDGIGVLVSRSILLANGSRQTHAPSNLTPLYSSVLRIRISCSCGLQAGILKPGIPETHVVHYALLTNLSGANLTNWNELQRSGVRLSSPTKVEH